MMYILAELIKPFLFPGLDSFKGKVVHTHDYRDHVGYEDKRVVVVGIGNSGGDVAVELSRIAKQVLHKNYQTKLDNHTQIFLRYNSMNFLF